jgi:cytoskeletal protein CcmA (bactofilin family)
VDAPPDSGATLSVSDSGVVEGSVAVPNVILNGTVKGDILAHERVELGATARVTGNVYYALIEMEMGAEITGKLIHEPRRGGVGRQEPEIKPPADGSVADPAS